MNISDSVNLVASKFEYTQDPTSLFDYWHIMKEDPDGVLRGDCEDFSLTAIWIALDRNLFKFIWNVLILHRYRLHRVETKESYHAVGSYNDLWFDNWTRRALPKEEFFKETQHKYLYMYVSPLMLYPLIRGLFKR